MKTLVGQLCLIASTLALVAGQPGRPVTDNRIREEDLEPLNDLPVATPNCTWLHYCNRSTVSGAPCINGELDRRFNYNFSQSVSMYDETGHIGYPIVNRSSGRLTSQLFYFCEILRIIELPNSVQTIGWYAFAMSGLHTITLPRSLNKIEAGAFHGTNIATITLPGPSRFGLWTELVLGVGVFRECRYLRSILLSERVRQLPAGFASECSSLVTMAIPHSVQTIGAGAFWNCSALTEISFDSNSILSTVEPAAFSHSGLINLSLPGTVTTIYGADRAPSPFYYSAICSPTSILGNSNSDYCSSGSRRFEIYHIAGGAFAHCRNLTHIILPSDLREVSAQMFSGCINLQNIDLPPALVSIQREAFLDCSHLQDVSVLDDDGRTILRGTFPRTLMLIGSRAFANCTSLTTAVLPDSLVALMNDVFEGCNSIENVSLPVGVPAAHAFPFARCRGTDDEAVTYSRLYGPGAVIENCSSAFRRRNYPPRIDSLSGRHREQATVSQRHVIIDMAKRMGNRLHSYAAPSERHALTCCSDRPYLDHFVRPHNDPLSSVPGATCRLWTARNIAFNGSTPRCFPSVTLSRAENICNSSGARLCSAFELANADCGLRSGCSFLNGATMWSSTKELNTSEDSARLMGDLRFVQSCGAQGAATGVCQEAPIVDVDGNARGMQVQAGLSYQFNLQGNISVAFDGYRQAIIRGVVTNTTVANVSEQDMDGITFTAHSYRCSAQQDSGTSSWNPWTNCEDNDVLEGDQSPVTLDCSGRLSVATTSNMSFITRIRACSSAGEPYCTQALSMYFLSVALNFRIRESAALYYESLPTIERYYDGSGVRVPQYFPHEQDLPDILGVREVRQFQLTDRILDAHPYYSEALANRTRQLDLHSLFEDESGHITFQIRLEAPASLSQCVTIILDSNSSLNLIEALSYEDLMRPIEQGEFMIESDFGFLSITPLRPLCTRLTVIAVDDEGSSYEITTKILVSLVRDTDNSLARGPNDRGCGNGFKIDTGSLYDGRYSCFCPFGLSGSNCESNVPMYLTIGSDSGQYIPDNATADDYDGCESGTCDSNEMVNAGYNRTLWGYGKTYQLAPFAIVGAQLVNAANNLSIPISAEYLAFSLRWDGAYPSSGFFVDGETGELFVRIPSYVEGSDTFTTQGSLLISLKDRSNLTTELIEDVPGQSDLQHATVHPYTVTTLSITMLLVDTENPAATGPNNGDCMNGARKIDNLGDSEFDGTYSCQCICNESECWRGRNCEESATISTAQSGSSTKDTAIAAGSAVAAMLSLVALLLLLHIRQLRRIRNQPQDFEEIQRQVLASLGLNPIYSLADNEIGITLSMAEPPDGLIDRTPLLEDHTLARGSEFQIKLTQTLAESTSLVCWATAAISIDWNLRHISIRAARPNRVQTNLHNAGRFDENLLEHLLKHIRNGQFICSSWLAIDACLQVPTRIPREIPRNAVSRLDLVGEGAFGEVFKAMVSESRMRPYIAAAKAIKIKDADGENELFLRQELMSEAALMALLEHPNILGLIGVITVPRTVPALLLLEYCDGGTLLDFVRVQEITPASQLSLLADVASGLAYLSGRRIVHRDVAARNVLLSASLTAKVADFGMAVTIGGDATTYVRVKGQMPIRWSAIEVLQSNKYSTASDVWAYGIVCLEVMTRGAVPYEHLATLADVSEWVKGGHIPSQPVGCSDDVFSQLMSACWNRTPSKRPSFSELRSAALALGGAQEEGPSAADDIWDKLRNEHSTEYFGTPEGRQYLGVSVKHISSTLYSQVSTATKAPYVDKHGNTIPSPALATISQAVNAFVKPYTKLRVCPRDGQPGSAYVDAIEGPKNVGAATTLLSYSWKYALRDVGDALESWCHANGRDTTSTYAWVCSLCLNQWRMVAKQTPESLAREFGTRVVEIGRVTPMLNTWQATEYVSRAWCLFELYIAITRRDSVAINVILPSSQIQLWLDAVQADGYSAQDKTLAEIRSQDAKATESSDLNAIRAIVCSMPGGFDTLNHTVKRHLVQWFESLGAVHTAARVRTMMRSAAATPARQPPQYVATPRFSVNSIGSTSVIPATRSPDTYLTLSDDDDGGNTRQYFLASASQRKSEESLPSRDNILTLRLRRESIL